MGISDYPHLAETEAKKDPLLPFKVTPPVSGATAAFQFYEWLSKARLPLPLKTGHAWAAKNNEVVSRAAQTMLDLHQTRRSLNVEYYIVVLIVFEIALALIQLFR